MSFGARENILKGVIHLETYLYNIYSFHFKTILSLFGACFPITLNTKDVPVERVTGLSVYFLPLSAVSYDAC